MTGNLSKRKKNIDNIYTKAEVGPKLENHPLFPERTNVEFVEILPDQSLRMRVWERDRKSVV